MTLVVGVPGSGKSYYVRSLYAEDDIYSHPGSSAWFDGYEQQQCLLWDDFYGAGSKWALDDLLRVLDKYKVRLNVKRAHTYLHSTEIFLTSNVHPYSWYDWKGRGLMYWALMRRIHRVLVIEDNEEHTVHEIVGAEYARFVGEHGFGPEPGESFYGWTVEPSSYDRQSVGRPPTSISSRFQ